MSIPSLPRNLALPAVALSVSLLLTACGGDSKPSANTSTGGAVVAPIDPGGVVRPPDPPSPPPPSPGGEVPAGLRTAEPEETWTDRFLARMRSGSDTAPAPATRLKADQLRR